MRGDEKQQTVGVLCAMPEELGRLAELATGCLERQGLKLLEIPCEGFRLLACVGGVGKVQAAQAATLLLAEGVSRALLIVGTCGGLRRDLGPGTLVHCQGCVQTDLAVKGIGRFEADSALRSAWMEEVPGALGDFLTADRPVFSFWRRRKLLLTERQGRIVDMETAAAAAVATRASVPWAALRAVTDRADAKGMLSFRQHYAKQAGRAADTVPDLLLRLSTSIGQVSDH